MNDIVLTTVVIAQGAIITKMSIDRSYGCLTRAAFDILNPALKLLGFRYIAIDVDGFKQHNSARGHEAVNRAVKSSVRSFVRARRRGDLSFGDIVFRYYSGDEFMIATRSKNLQVIASRLIEAFRSEGFEITIDVDVKNVERSMLTILDTKRNK